MCFSMKIIIEASEGIRPQSDQRAKSPVFQNIENITYQQCIKFFFKSGEKGNCL